MIFTGRYTNMGRFDVVYQGVVYESVGGSLSESFILWCNLCKESGGVFYGSHNLLLLMSVMFPAVVDGSDSVSEELSGGFVGFGDD